MKKYRYFYHYYKQYKCMSVHFRGNCYRTQNVECTVPSETHWNKTQPNLIVRGFASGIDILKDKIVIK